MERELAGKVALITGASRGIGRACALRLAHAGADIALNYHHHPDDAEVLKELLIQDYGVQAECFAADVASAEQTEKMFQDVMTRWGRLDILINNAGITRDGLLLRMKPEDWDAVMNVNLKGLFHCSRLASKIMLKQKSGRMVNISSVVGQTGNAGQSNYAASKAGVLGFTKSLALELAPRGIAVNAVAPGYIESDMTQALNETVREQALKKIPLGRFGECSEVAEVVLFLSSERCRYLTGQTLNVDGGLVMF